MASFVKEDEFSVSYGRAYSDERALFITKTYNHLFGALVAFILFEVVLFKTELVFPIAKALFSIPWIAVIGLFIVVSWGARSLAYQQGSKASQYMGLGLYVIIEGVIFAPLLLLASLQDPSYTMISSAGIVTLVGFTGLTLIAHLTKKDFSFLGGLLRWGFVCALLLIVGGLIFGFELGVFFSVAMVALAGGAILYDTSKIIHDFPTDNYVGAALELFASVALMFWYVLRIFMSRD